MIDLNTIQEHLKNANVDGWLIYDFNKQNSLAYDLLKLDPHKICKRRFFYWIPKVGIPIKILHAIEPDILKALPGNDVYYSSWQSLHETLRNVLKGFSTVAMEFSPFCNNPYVSKVDGGTIDLVRSFGMDVRSSSQYVHYFTSKLDDHQISSHFLAAQKLEKIAFIAFSYILEKVKAGETITEFDVAQKILQDFGRFGLVTDYQINVSVNQNSANPHYHLTRESALKISLGDFVLIDIWGKLDQPNSVFADITKVAVLASEPTEKQKKIFSIVRSAQKNALRMVEENFNKRAVLGCEVDDAARSVIQTAGFGDYFTHRTGHNIGTHLHGSGTHLDNFETRDDRPLISSTCFSIEPGIYLPGEFGVRLEHDVMIDSKGKIYVTGGVQEEILCLV